MQVQNVCTAVWTAFSQLSERLPHLFPTSTRHINIHISTSAGECDLSLDQSTSQMFKVTRCTEGKNSTSISKRLYLIKTFNAAYISEVLNYTGWRTKCLTIDCAHNTFLLLQKHLTPGTELILIGWKIVPNEEHVQCDHRFASQPLANEPFHSSQLFDTSLQKARGTTSLCGP